ncbi:MAG: MBL fold metallo-hydrolase RNA specificity domain-containing protein [Candidatus Kariarchaeaceae archaeon]
MKSNNINITGYGACGYVGKSSFIIHDNDRQILLDAGLKIQSGELTQAPKGIDKHVPFLDGVIISHAHTDHSTYTPSLIKHGFQGSIHMTPPTRDISQVLWADHMKIEGERHWSEEDFLRTFSQIETHKYHEKFKLADGITAEFYNAGHILGSAITVIDWDGTRILYTGDFNDKITAIFDGFEIPEEEVDIVITESTNGIRDIPKREIVNKQLMSKTRETLARGGKMLIPTFSIGRSQELLFEIAREKGLDNVPVYIDGMIRSMNAITNRYLRPDFVAPKVLDQVKDLGGKSPLKKDNFYEVTRENFGNTGELRRRVSRSEETSIIVSTAGMLDAGPIHTYLDGTAHQRKNTLAFVGYQVEGTQGRNILDGGRKMVINKLMRRPKTIKLDLEIVRFHYSGHTSKKGIKSLMELTNPKEVILVHGDLENQQNLINYLSNGRNYTILDEKKEFTYKI